MKALRRIVALMCFLAVSLALCSCSTKKTTSADYPEYQDANSLVDAADMVFIGTVNRVTEENLSISQNSDETLLYNVVEVTVHEVLKGTYTDEDISIKVLGGVVGDNSLQLEDGIAVNVEGEYLFTVATFANSYPSLLNMTQSVYDTSEPATTYSSHEGITLAQILLLFENY